MASGSSGRGNPSSKGFDFASDDILCSYEDFSNRDSNSNGNHSDSAIAPNSNKVYTYSFSIFPFWPLTHSFLAFNFVLKGLGFTKFTNFRRCIDYDHHDG